jgi:hypothetical protein
VGPINDDRLSLFMVIFVDVIRIPGGIAASSWQNRSPVSTTAFVSAFPASAEVGDPSATRTVYVTVVLLIALSVALAALALWLARRTRPEPQLLAPLEEMETRTWRKQDPAAQRRALDASRPTGARPVRPEVAEPILDTDFAAARPVVGFDDLADGAAATDSAVADLEFDDGVAGADDITDAHAAPDADDLTDVEADVEADVDTAVHGEAADDLPDEISAGDVGADQPTEAIPEMFDPPEQPSAEAGNALADPDADLADPTEDVDEVGATSDVETDSSSVTVPSSVTEKSPGTERSSVSDTSPDMTASPDEGEGEGGAVATGRRMLRRFRRT